MKTRIILFAYCLIFISYGLGQKVEISGHLTEKSGKPIPGVSITVHEVNTGTFSDSVGYYRLKDLKPGIYHIHFEALEYKAQAHTIDTRKGAVVLNISLVPSQIELQQVLIEADPFKSLASEQPLSIERLDGDYFNKHLNTNFAAMLSRLPGISTIQMGVGIAKPVIRGLSMNRVAVIDNGIKQEGQQWAADHGLEIDVYNVERVEIIKGPASLIYGSDATAGVIQLKPSLEPCGFGGNFRLTYMSVNHNVGSSTMLEGKHKHYFYRARFSTQHYGDYSVPAHTFNYNRYVLPIYNHTLKNTAGRELNASFTGGYLPKWGKLRFTATMFDQNSGMFAGAIGVPRSYLLSDDYNRRNIDIPSMQTRHYRLLSNANIALGKNWVEIDAGYQFNDRQENSFPHTHGQGTRPQGTEALGLKLQTFALNTRFHFKHSLRLASLVGANVQYQTNRIGGFEFFIPNYTAGQGGIFLHEKFHWTEKLVLSGGIRFDVGKINIQSFVDSLFAGTPKARLFVRNPMLERNFTNVSGALGLSYFPRNFLVLKWNVANHFRYPTAVELAANGVHHGNFRHEQGNSSLSPERGVQTDLTTQIEFTTFMFKCSYFFNYFQNYIYLSPVAQYSFLPEGGQIYQYQENPALHTGTEITLEYHPLKALHFAANYAYVYTQNLTDYLPLPMIPPATALFELEYQFPKIGKWLNNWTFMVDMRIYDHQTRVVRNEKPTVGSTIYNCTLKAQFNTKFSLTLYAQVVNVFDRYYFMHLNRYRLLNLPEAGRNLILTLAFDFTQKLK